MAYIIREQIINVIIGDMLRHEKENEGWTRANTMSSFNWTEDSEGHFIVSIKQVKQFLLVNCSLRRELSSAMMLDTIKDVKDRAVLLSLWYVAIIWFIRRLKQLVKFWMRKSLWSLTLNGFYCI